MLLLDGVTPQPHNIPQLMTLAILLTYGQHCALNVTGHFPGNGLSDVILADLQK